LKVFIWLEEGPDCQGIEYAKCDEEKEDILSGGEMGTPCRLSLSGSLELTIGVGRSS
jgi:hypothetical protein